jgi:hypothetical protein
VPKRIEGPTLSPRLSLFVSDRASVSFCSDGNIFDCLMVVVGFDSYLNCLNVRLPADERLNERYFDDCEEYRGR